MLVTVWVSGTASHRAAGPNPLPIRDCHSQILKPIFLAHFGTPPRAALKKKTPWPPPPRNWKGPENFEFCGQAKGQVPVQILLGNPWFFLKHNSKNNQPMDFWYYFKYQKKRGNTLHGLFKSERKGFSIALPRSQHQKISPFLEPAKVKGWGPDPLTQHQGGRRVKTAPTPSWPSTSYFNIKNFPRSQLQGEDIFTKI